MFGRKEEIHPGSKSDHAQSFSLVYPGAHLVVSHDSSGDQSRNLADKDLSLLQ